MKMIFGAWINHIMKLRNKYYILRHGEALSNVKRLNSSWPETFKNPLTNDGIEMIKKSVSKLIKKGAKIDFIFSSDLLRTKQTAEIASKILKVKKITFEKRLREIDFGNANGMPIEELLYMGFVKKRINNHFKQGEDYYSVLRRVLSFLKDIDKKYPGKQILIVSHQAPLWVLENRIEGYSLREGLKRVPRDKRISRGELRELKPGSPRNK